MNVFGQPTWLGLTLFVVGVVGSVVCLGRIIYLYVQGERSLKLLRKMAEENGPPPTTFE
jgi:hypothetical protein